MPKLSSPGHLALEAAPDYRRLRQPATRKPAETHRWLAARGLFVLVTGLTLLPTFITRWIIYGSAFESSYPSVAQWSWKSPALLPVLFSADHGMLSWTPILIPSVLGLALFWRCDRLFGGGLLLVFCAFYYFME